MPRSISYVNDFATAHDGTATDDGNDMSWTISAGVLRSTYVSGIIAHDLDGFVTWSLDPLGATPNYDIQITCNGPNAGGPGRGGPLLGSALAFVGVRETVAGDASEWELYYYDALTVHVPVRLSTIKIPSGAYPMKVRLVALDLDWLGGNRNIMAKVWSGTEPSWLDSSATMCAAYPLATNRVNAPSLAIFDTTTTAHYYEWNDLTVYRLDVPHPILSHSVSTTVDATSFTTSSGALTANRPISIAIAQTDPSVMSVLTSVTCSSGSVTIGAVLSTQGYDSIGTPTKKVFFYSAMASADVASCTFTANFDGSVQACIIHVSQWDGANASSADGSAAFVGIVTASSDTNATTATATISSFASTYGRSTVYGQAAHNENEGATKDADWFMELADNSHAGNDHGMMTAWDTTEEAAWTPSWASSRRYAILACEVVAHDVAADYPFAILPRMPRPTTNPHVRM